MQSQRALASRNWPAAPRTQRSARRELETAMRFIGDSLGDPDLTIEKCAAAAGCSVSSLTKIFRRQLGVSPAKYIRDLRLEKALHLIQQGLSVRDTCEACGFGSTETFHRVFKVFVLTLQISFLELLFQIVPDVGH